MPFAQFHYPFENKEKFEQNFPGDFIVEYVPQVRAWFYYLSAVNTGLFGHVPFKTALVHGTLAGNDGRKMSKSYGNYTDPNELMDQYSADSLRFLLLSSPLLNAEDFSLKDKDVADVARKLKHDRQHVRLLHALRLCRRLGVGWVLRRPTRLVRKPFGPLDCLPRARAICPDGRRIGCLQHLTPRSGPTCHSQTTPPIGMSAAPANASGNPAMM